MPGKGPNLPELYALYTELHITSHRPPEPFGKAVYKRVKTPGVPDISQETIEKIGDEDLTFARHPRERDRHASALLPMPDWFMEDQQATLKIRSPVSHGKWGPQVVLCEVVKPPRNLWKKMGQEIPDMIVAKIFDPLHYFDCDDRVAEADREYAAEAAAYMHLHGQRHTKAYKPGFVPQYFGSWTTDITLSHLEKLFMSEAEKKATAKKEAQARAAFDADVAASIKAAHSPAEPAGAGPAGAETSDVPPQATELKVHDFRPVRLILLQHIKGTSLARQLTVKTIGNNSVTIKPKSDFLEERVRTEIFGKIMDSVVRIEHLGINTSTIKPSMFIITGNKEEESKKSKNKKNKGKEKATSNDGTYDVVMVDFTQVDVTHYTLMDYNIHQKLPLPMHPVSWGTPRRHWFSFRGWIPEVWFADVKKYDEWGQAYFESDNYSTPKVVNDICESVGWLNDMIKYGYIKPRPEDNPEWQALLKKNNANMPEWGQPYRNEHGFKTKEEYDRHREQTAVANMAARAEDKERSRKKRAALRDKIKAQEQAKEEAAAKKATVEQLGREMQAVAIAGASANDPADVGTPRQSSYGRSPSDERPGTPDSPGRLDSQGKQHHRQPQTAGGTPPASGDEKRGSGDPSSSSNDSSPTQP